MRTLRSVVPAVALALLCAAPAAAQDVYNDYRNDGQVDTCQYSDDQLRQGLDGLSPDVIQYSPGLADQLAAGREGCGGGAPGAPTDTRELELVPGPQSAGGAGGGPGADGTAVARIPNPPAPKAAERPRLADIATPTAAATTRADVPGWVIALIVAFAAAALAAVAIRAIGARSGGAMRAAFADAGGRTADAFSQLWDSVRLGR